MLVSGGNHCITERQGTGYSPVTEHQLKARCDGQRETYKETHPPGG